MEMKRNEAASARIKSMAFIILMVEIIKRHVHTRIAQRPLEGACVMNWRRGYCRQSLCVRIDNRQRANRFW